MTMRLVRPGDLASSSNAALNLLALLGLAQSSEPQMASLTTNSIRYNQNVLFAFLQIPNLSEKKSCSAKVGLALKILVVIYRHKIAIMYIACRADYRSLNPFTPESDQCQISPPASTRNITSHSKENLAFHSLLRWKMIILPTLITSLMHLLFKRLGECTFSAQE